MIVSLALMLIADVPAATPAPTPAAINPRAMELLDSDPALKAWAVRTFDSNRDGWLTIYEAQPAVDAFRDLADGDKDRHVTVDEFSAAVAFIRSRY